MSSWNEFEDKISRIREMHSKFECPSALLFRGQADESWRIKSTLERRIAELGKCHEDLDYQRYVAMGALVAFALYRRFRRLFGRQLLSPARLKFRIGLLSIVAAMFALRGFVASDIAIAGVVGFAIGGALAWLGVRLTRFERTPNGIYYTPNAIIGAAVSLLLIGRLAYRFFAVYPAMQAAHLGGGDPLSAYQKSPLTAALFGVAIGYYIAYYVGVLLRSAGATDASSLADPRSPPSGP